MSELESRHYLLNGGETQPDAREALEWASETSVSMVDLKFCDLLGTWQHVTLPLRAFDESAFDEGLGFDGSSIRGWQGISEPDLLLLPDPTSAILDPATEAPTLSLVCEVVDPVTREPYPRDPRRVARRAEEYLRTTGIADTCFVGPECGFFVFDEVSYELGPNAAHYSVDYKYVVKNVARAHGKSVTFMPKPIFGDNGSGMHCHQSLWQEGVPLMAERTGYAGLSQLARSYVGGLLLHAPALLAFCAPTTNSYCRLVPGYEAPVNLVYSQRNRSACIRIPMYSDAPQAKRIEFRCPDAAANPYLAFSAMLLAGIDGIQREIDPGAPADYDLFEDAGHDVLQVPGSLAEALDALEADHEFLLAGGVFTEDLIRTWIDWKRTNEVDVVRLRPHPAEFALYYDA